MVFCGQVAIDMDSGSTGRDSSEAAPAVATKGATRNGAANGAAAGKDVAMAAVRGDSGLRKRKGSAPAGGTPSFTSTFDGSPTQLFALCSRQSLSGNTRGFSLQHSKLILPDAQHWFCVWQRGLDGPMALPSNGQLHR